MYISGDWGLQIGLIITELKHRKIRELVYLDNTYEGEYPTEPPFTMSDLEEIYPYASGYSKEHEDYKEEAQEATAQLQAGRRRLFGALEAYYRRIGNRSA